jgi:uncharacterized damage-inducible protein DinB
MHLTLTLLLAFAAAADTVSGNLVDLYAVVSGDLVAAARKMPADRYDYRPTPDVRSFGEIIGHLAGSQFLYCAQAKGGGFDRALATRLGPIRTYADGPTGGANAVPTAAPSKETLVALLEEGVAFCRPIYDAMTDAAVVEPIGRGSQRTIRFRRLVENVAHDNEHYGNLVTYLRLNGLVPPSTERQSDK